MTAVELPFDCMRLLRMATMVCFLLFILGAEGIATERLVVQVLRDFEDMEPGPLKYGQIEPYYWPADLKAKAPEFSSSEVVTGTPFGRKCLQFSLSKHIPWVKDRLPVSNYQMPKIFSFLDYLSPEVDALRLRVKITEGQFTLAAGSPTIYFGNSDVLTKPVTVSSNDEWQTIEFSLTEGLSRNQRRGGFTSQSPVIHYVRWVQEPLHLVVFEGSYGKILIDQVELVTLGKGNPYPVFDAAAVKTLAPVVKFDEVEDLQRAFTIFMQGDTDLPSGNAVLLRPLWSPSRLQLQDVDGRHVLDVRNRFIEEVSLAGVKCTAPREANAVRLLIKAENPKYEIISLDFVAYVGPDGRIPWEELEPPATWKKDPEIAFTYYMCRNNVKGISFGYYHARRGIDHGKWTELMIPFDDFICAYGQGECTPLFMQQKPLRPEDIAAIAFLGSYRQRSEVRILIDEVSFVRVPGDAAVLRSFAQPLVSGRTGLQSVEAK